MCFKTGVVVSSNLKLYKKYVNKVLTTINKIVDAMEAYISQKRRIYKGLVGWILLEYVSCQQLVTLQHTHFTYTKQKKKI